MIGRRRFLVLMNAGVMSPFLVPKALADIDDDYGDDDPGGDWGDDDGGGDDDADTDRDDDIWREDNAANFDKYGINDRAPDVAGGGLTEVQAAAVNEPDEAKTAPRTDPDEYYSEEPVRQLFSDAANFLDTVIQTVKENVADFVSELDDMTFPLRNAFGPSGSDSLIAYETSYAAGPTFGNVNPQVDSQGGAYVTAVVAEVPVVVGGAPMEAGGYVTIGRSPDGSAYLADGVYLGYQEINLAGYAQTQAYRDLNFQVGLNVGAEDYSIDVDVRGSIDRIGAAYDRAAEEFGQALSNIQRNMYDEMQLMNMR